MKKYLIIAAIIAFAAVIINYVLGGFNKIEPGLVTTEKEVVYGREYEGRYNSEALDNLISELRTILSNSSSKGQLTIINYLRPDLEQRGTVKQFVGIIWDKNKVTNSDYDSLILESYNGAQFRIPISPLVMPSPEKLKGLAETMAVDMSSSLAGYSVEQYQDRTLVINFPFKSAD